MKMNILESRNKSALPNAPEWAKRIRAEKRPLHLAAKSSVIFARTSSVEAWEQKSVAKTAFEHNSFNNKSFLK